MTATDLAANLIAKIRKYWPDPAVLAAITDPSQIDNAPEPWLVTYADNLEKLATSQKWIIGGLEVVAMKRKKEHSAPFERTPEREALMTDYVAALRDYILTEPTLIERAIAVLDHQSDAHLTKAIADVQTLTALQRKQLIQLVEADDQAEQRAAARAARDARQAALQSELEARRAKLEPKD
ncbi:MAG: hypothetical protein WKG01_41510 [Kofleriaceae bacterium]